MTTPVDAPMDVRRMDVPAGSTSGFDLAGSRIVWWDSHSRRADRIRLLSFDDMGRTQPLGYLFTGGVVSAATDPMGDAILVQPTACGEDTPAPVLLRREGSCWSAVAAETRFSHVPAVTAIARSDFLLVGTASDHEVDRSGEVYRMRGTGMRAVGRLQPGEQLVGPRPLLSGGPATVIARTRTGEGPELLQVWRLTDVDVERAWEQPLPAAVPVAVTAGQVMALARRGSRHAELRRLDPGTGHWDVVDGVPYALDIAAVGNRTLVVGGRHNLRLSLWDAQGASRLLHEFAPGERVVRMASASASGDLVVLLTRTSTGLRHAHCLSTGGDHAVISLHEPPSELREPPNELREPPNELHELPNAVAARPLHRGSTLVTSRMTAVSADVNTLHRSVIPALVSAGAKVRTVDRCRRMEPLDPDLYLRFMDVRPVSERYLLEGHSVDAVPALIAACARPESVTALILRFPVLDLAALARQPGGWRWRDALDRTVPGWRTGHEPMRLIEHARSLPPVLIVTGRHDTRATRDAGPFFTRYRLNSRAPEGCRLIQYDCGHDRHVDPGPAAQQVRDLFAFITFFISVSSVDDGGYHNG